MATINVKPTGNARRQISYTDFSILDKGKRVKKLTFGKIRKSGRNHAGQIVVMRKGGGEKRIYRTIDFKRTDFLGKTAEVMSIEYDPNRSAFIALIKYETGELSYILATSELKKGAKVITDEKTPVRVGNRMKLKNIPASTAICDIEMTCGKGGQFAKSAGSFAIVLGIDGKYAILRMPSGETRKVLAECYATIGIVSNLDHSNLKIGKAGRTRHMGKRPEVRGKAKNPCDHPHGGGEGGTSIGLPYPKTPWGAPALGRRTRNKKKQLANLIINRRKK